MKVLVWNVKGAKENRGHLWEYFSEFEPDVALLQELGNTPSDISAGYSILCRKAYAGNGSDQIFSTAVAVKGEIVESIDFSTPWDWVNEELENFKGNIIAAKVRLANGETYNVASVYSPAWPIFERSRHTEIDVSPIAQKFGGGGHAGAAGFHFQRSTTPFPPEATVSLNLHPHEL